MEQPFNFPTFSFTFSDFQPFFSFSIYRKVVILFISLRANKFHQKHCQVWLWEKISSRLWARKHVKERANVSEDKNRQVWHPRILQVISGLAKLSIVKNEKRHFEIFIMESWKLNFEKLVGHFEKLSVGREACYIPKWCDFPFAFLQRTKIQKTCQWPTNSSSESCKC